MYYRFYPSVPNSGANAPFSLCVHHNLHQAFHIIGVRINDNVEHKSKIELDEIQYDLKTDLRATAKANRIRKHAIIQFTRM